MDAFTSTFGYRISNMTEATSAATPPISAGALPAVRAVLVDDEKLARANLRHALSEVPGWQVVAECSSAAAARAALSVMPADVVFLDVQMPEETGLSLARKLVTEDSPPVIVFVTAYDQYAIEAFEVHALDYLQKPFDDARLAQTLTRARELVSLRQSPSWREAVSDAMETVDDARHARPSAPLTRVCVRSVGKVETVPIDSVRWIASAGNYVELHLGERSVLHRVPLSQLEKRLDPEQFMRVHRTALVRKALISGIKVTGDGTYNAILNRDEQVPVSERYVTAVRELLEDDLS